MAIKTKKNNNQLLSITRYIVEKYKFAKPVRLQKILYFLYLEYLKEYNEKLFEEEFEAWVYGPVLRKLFAFIKNNGFNFYEIEEDEYIEEIVSLENEKIKSFIDKTIPKYLEYDASVLVEMTHKSMPWIKARKGLKEDEISAKKLNFKDLKNYAKAENFNW